GREGIPQDHPDPRPQRERCAGRWCEPAAAGRFAVDVDAAAAPHEQPDGHAACTVRQDAAAHQFDHLDRAGHDHHDYHHDFLATVTRVGGQHVVAAVVVAASAAGDAAITLTG